MTIIERWTRAISGAIGIGLGMALLVYLFGRGRPVFNETEIYVYVFVAFTYLCGWLEGSRAERKSNRLRLTS